MCLQTGLEGCRRLPVVEESATSRRADKMAGSGAEAGVSKWITFVMNDAFL
jgi:hypothetical protein